MRRVGVEAIAAVSSGRYEFADAVEDACADAYVERFPGANIRAFSYHGADYLFDERPGIDRTILVVAPPGVSSAARDRSYQQRFPLTQSEGGRPTDRGHYIAHAAGGLFGPNIFVQDTALNRGWSRDGRAYRALERAAISAGPDALLFVRPIYVDDDGAPAQIELGYWMEGQVHSRVFQNRFDEVALDGLDRFAVALGAATNDEAASLGEESALVLLQAELDAEFLDADDSTAERDGHRHGLDLLLLIDGEVVAVEVKTRHVGREAGRLTRAGNLLRPRLRSSNLDGLRQGSDEYVAVRANRIIDAGVEHGYPESRVMVVDLVSMLAQVFVVTPTGRTGAPASPPISCAGAAREAFERIMQTRGSLAARGQRDAGSPVEPRR